MPSFIFAGLPEGEDKVSESRQHFWHSVCGNNFVPRSTAPSLMFKAITTSDCIQATYGMSQSDKKNNAVNRRQEITTRRKRFEK